MEAQDVVELPELKRLPGPRLEPWALPTPEKPDVLRSKRTYSLPTYLSEPARHEDRTTSTLIQSMARMWHNRVTRHRLERQHKREQALMCELRDKCQNKRGAKQALAAFAKLSPQMRKDLTVQRLALKALLVEGRPEPSLFTLVLAAARERVLDLVALGVRTHNAAFVEYALLLGDVDRRLLWRLAKDAVDTDDFLVFETMARHGLKIFRPSHVQITLAMRVVWDTMRTPKRRLQWLRMLAQYDGFSDLPINLGLRVDASLLNRRMSDAQIVNDIADMLSDSVPGAVGWRARLAAFRATQTGVPTKYSVVGTIFRPDGATYRGELRHGLPHGFGVTHYPDQTVFVGRHVLGMPTQYRPKKTAATQNLDLDFKCADMPPTLTFQDAIFEGINGLKDDLSFWSLDEP